MGGGSGTTGEATETPRDRTTDDPLDSRECNQVMGGGYNQVMGGATSNSGTVLAPRLRVQQQWTALFIAQFFMQHFEYKI